MTAEEGNKLAVKLVSDELKIEAYLDYCAHIASGKSKKGWRFKDKDRLLCTWMTMEKYMEEMPDVLRPIHKAIADCESYAIWEKKGEDMMHGTVKCFEPAIYQMFMRNKFDWDKKEDSQ